MERGLPHSGGGLTLRTWVLLTLVPAGLALASGCVNDLEVLDVTGSDSPGIPSGPRPDILYRFDEGAGTRILDTSESGALLHLTIKDPGAVAWTVGGLRFDAESLAESMSAPTDFMASCRRSNQLTIEAWVTPSNLPAQGTRRIVSVSDDQSSRNFTLGMGDLFAAGPVAEYVFRLRTSEGGSANGLPGLSTGDGTARGQLTHVVAVHHDDGRSLVYLDGKSVSSGQVEGDFLNWNLNYKLAVGSEFSNDDERRAWLGEIHLIALYAAALGETDVAAHFAAGPAW